MIAKATENGKLVKILPSLYIQFVYISSDNRFITTQWLSVHQFYLVDIGAYIVAVTEFSVYIQVVYIRWHMSTFNTTYFRHPSLLTL